VSDYQFMGLVAAGLLALILLAIFLYWLLVTTEGAFLGRRVVVWLYDVTAHKYDEIKEYTPDDERLLVTIPVLSALRDIENPLVLDVATGTGRVPYDLLVSGQFQGQIVGLDDSRKMLQIARKKLSAFKSQVKLLNQPAVPLPFPDNAFDAVTCLEALEFFPSDEAALCEMVRVLKPGCYLLTTRRRGTEAKLFLSRYRSRDEMGRTLESMGLEEVGFHAWQINYDLVTARKENPEFTA
jgi:SAM-dependent methyltransferase